MILQQNKVDPDRAVKNLSCPGDVARLPRGSVAGRFHGEGANGILHINSQLVMTVVVASRDHPAAQSATSQDWLPRPGAQLGSSGV